MSLQDVRQALQNTPLEKEIFKLAHTGATVAEAADALGGDPDQIAKTLSLLLDTQPILIVVSGTARIDNKKYKAVFHKKARFIAPENVEDLVGHPPGGVCPFGFKNGIAVYLDESLRRHAVVYPSAGDRDYAIRVPLETLQNLTGGTWIDVTVLPQE